MVVSRSCSTNFIMIECSGGTTEIIKAKEESCLKWVSKIAIINPLSPDEILC